MPPPQWTTQLCDENTLPARSRRSIPEGGKVLWSGSRALHACAGAEHAIAAPDEIIEPPSWYQENDSPGAGDVQEMAVPLMPTEGSSRRGGTSEGRKGAREGKRHGPATRRSPRSSGRSTSSPPRSLVASLHTPVLRTASHRSQAAARAASSPRGSFKPKESDHGELVQTHAHERGQSARRPSRSPGSPARRPQSRRSQSRGSSSTRHGQASVGSPRMSGRRPDTDGEQLSALARARAMLSEVETAAEAGRVHADKALLQRLRLVIEHASAKHAVLSQQAPGSSVAVANAASGAALAEARSRASSSARGHE